MSFPEIDPRQSFVVVNGNEYFILKLVENGHSCRFIHLKEDSIPNPAVVERYLSENRTHQRFPLELNQRDKSFLRDQFPLLYELTEELHVVCFLSKNDQANMAPSVIISEGEYKRRRRQVGPSVFIKDVANRWKVQQKANVTSNAPKAQSLLKEQEPSGIDLSKVDDVDTLVAMIEGTHLKTSDPKKTAKKARQKERKELVRQLKEQEKIVDEEIKKKREELRQLELEAKDFIQERWRMEAEEWKQQDDLVRKQEEAADMKKVEQPLKLEETDLGKTEKKKLKKQRRDQRKKELEGGESNEGGMKTKTTQERRDLIAKTEPKPRSEDKESAKKAAEIASEKDFGRIKYEKEQRKREEEEARRIEQLQAHERARANKKNKKKKKQNHDSESSSQSASDGSGQGGEKDSSKGPDSFESKSPSAGALILDLLKASSSRSQGKGDERNNLVTIKKNMNSIDTVSMKGREEKKDLMCTRMNCQVDPTNNSGRKRSEDGGPLQQTAFVKLETARPNHIRTPSATVNNAGSPYATPVKTVGYTVYPAKNASGIRSEDTLPLQQTAFVEPETARYNPIRTPPATDNSGGYPFATTTKAMGYTVYPTNNDAHTRSEDTLPVQKTEFFKSETVRANHISTSPATVNVDSGCSHATPVKAMGYPSHCQGHGGGIYRSPIISDNSGFREVGLSQPKLPPGITNVPQHLTGVRGEDDVNGMQHPHFRPRQVHSSMTEYARIASMSGIDTGYNPNVMVVDGRCSSLESPVIGIRPDDPSDVMYGAYGASPSSDSGIDSMGHNGTNLRAKRPAFYSNEMLHARAPTSLFSPFASTSRKETPSAGWATDYKNINGIPGMIPNTSADRPNGQGLWSSIPANPVDFQASSVTKIVRAQDEQLKFRNVGFASEPEILPHKVAQFTQSASVVGNPDSYAVGSTINGSYASNVQPWSSGAREVTLPSHSLTYDLWSPWGSPSSPLMKPPQYDKDTGNLTVNPYGPIGSNISRRSSSDASNRINQNDKPTGSPRSDNAAFWSYDQIF